jgi:hypothetical protein
VNQQLCRWKDSWIPRSEGRSRGDFKADRGEWDVHVVDQDARGVDQDAFGSDQDAHIPVTNA